MNNNMADNKIEIVKIISKDIAKQGTKSLLVLIGVSLLFILFNLLFVVKVNTSNFFNGNLDVKMVLIELLVGIIFTIIAILLTKKYFIIKLVSMVYNYLSPFFKSLCDVVFESFYKKGAEITKKDKISKYINIRQIWMNNYNMNIPPIIQKAITYIINQIPFATIILDVRSKVGTRVSEEDTSYKEVVSAMIYEELDLYIRESILASNHFYQVLILFGVNVLIQYALAYFV